MTTSQFVGVTILGWLVFQVSKDVSSNGNNAAPSATPTLLLDNNIAYRTTTPTSSMKTASAIDTSRLRGGGASI